MELNVVEQCLNLYKTHVVQQKRYETGKEFGEEGVFPRIHGAVFNPRQGIMKSLKTDIWKRAEQLNSIYKFK